MNAPQISYVAVWSKQLFDNRNVFANVLGFPISYEDDNVVVFQTEGVQLVLQRAVDADASLDGTVQFGFNVEDLDRVTETLKASRLEITIDREELDLRQRVTALRLASGQTVEFIGQ